MECPVVHRKACMVRGCNRTVYKDRLKATSFFTLPSNESLRLRWLASLGESADLNKGIYVCQYHFKPLDLIHSLTKGETKTRVTYAPNAVPHAECPLHDPDSDEAQNPSKRLHSIVNNDVPYSDMPQEGTNEWQEVKTCTDLSDMCNKSVTVMIKQEPSDCPCEETEDLPSVAPPSSGNISLEKLTDNEQNLYVMLEERQMAIKQEQDSVPEVPVAPTVINSSRKKSKKHKDHPYHRKRSQYHAASSSTPDETAWQTNGYIHIGDQICRWQKWQSATKMSTEEFCAMLLDLYESRSCQNRDQGCGDCQEGVFPYQGVFPSQREFPTQGVFPSKGAIPSQGEFPFQGEFPSQGREESRDSDDSRATNMTSLHRNTEKESERLSHDDKIIYEIEQNYLENTVVEEKTRSGRTTKMRKFTTFFDSSDSEDDGNIQKKNKKVKVNDKKKVINNVDPDFAMSDEDSHEDGKKISSDESSEEGTENQDEFDIRIYKDKVIRMETEYNDLWCKACDESFKGLEDFRAHGKIRHKDRLPKTWYRCTKCDHKCAKYVTNLYHYEAVHGMPFPIFCEECGQTVRSLKTYKAHYIQHWRKINLKEEKQICDICGKWFSHVLTLRKHIRSTHKNIRPYPCRWEDCNKWFKSLWAKKMHMRIHTGEKPYMCSLCGFACSQKHSFDYHMNNKHQGETANKPAKENKK